MRPTRPFEYRSGELHCEQVDLNQIAEEFGTPCYIYSAEAIRCNYRTLKRWFEPLAPKICYAVKANSNLSVLRLLKQEGCGFDIVSGGELFRLNRVGVSPADIIYSGVGKTDAEIESAISQEIFSLVIESRAELKQVSRVARGRPVRISLRVNPEVDAQTHPYISTGLRQHKFGIDLEDLPSVLDLIHANSALELIGVGFHIGSQILEASPYESAFRKVRELADSIGSQGFPVTHLDLGGGFGIPYQAESPLNLS
jgi:diaminopimelate decarboxylase